jgi:DNA-binding LacI/PurR family transcriptional regulator
MSDQQQTIVNLADLARVAGVSPSTVSRALAGKSVVNPITREKISALAREHGFQLNQMARNLRLKKTQTIGVALPISAEQGQHLSDPFFAQMLRHLSEILGEQDYDLLLSKTVWQDPDWLERLVDSGRIDGLIMIGQANQIDNLDRLAERYKPLMVWGAYDTTHRHCTVGSDNRYGGKLAAERLIQLGRQHLLFIGNVSTPETAERYAGFAAACGAAGVAHEVLTAQLTSAIAEKLTKPHLPDGIFAASDLMAIDALNILTTRGVAVPSEVAVIGFDDTPLAMYSRPLLTTVRQDIATGAAQLVNALMQRLAGEETKPVIIPPELVIRQSA